ncbi:uncharacterized protein L969DRAFT_91413 [Mixia osmundae IAM 14324]|uniref:Uncharacterized protein n=1 Tax=Mixia osmundae (strain CBS 9802 / IAM 14324 / JCM 22182 / KY 12970) TaxID=764103 RepID=G7E3T8_MIXOS|nr:uncharacterized protein L969DRAFT_91413 [Mixia osmundae IAM 14324]KEI41943.1 hypothetical protein L969DRAFT_91413 [Mixia osmundae IAM 14324]GAA97498.1 hypothetical protein E5Q_04176 [Mixia osmundae IAM 14324]
MDDDERGFIREQLDGLYQPLRAPSGGSLGEDERGKTLRSTAIEEICAQIDAFMAKARHDKLLKDEEIDQLVRQIDILRSEEAQREMNKRDKAAHPDGLFLTTAQAQSNWVEALPQSWPHGDARQRKAYERLLRKVQNAHEQRDTLQQQDQHYKKLEHLVVDAMQ